jgi:magnesium transporter
MDMINQTRQPEKDGMNTQKHNGISWTHIENPTNETFAELEWEYHLHPVHLKESIQKVQHIQIEHEDGYLFFVLHVPAYDAKTDKISVNQVGVFLGKDYLITVSPSPVPFLATLFATCEQDAEQAEAYCKQGSAFLLYSLIRKLLDDISGMTENVIASLDEIEDLVFDNDSSDAQRIGKVRQKIVRLSRIIGPKRFVLEDLAQQVDSFSGPNMSKYYSNNTKTVSRLWEVIEEAKETVEIFKDADFTTSTEQTNKILAVLTLLFTFTIPITVVGTLYGMNVPLPGGIEAGAWTFLGRYTTFEIVLSLSVTAAAIMFLYFKRKKWF